MRENKPDNNDDPNSPNNNDRFWEGTHVVLHGLSTKGAHYNGLFGVVTSAAKGGRHKVTLDPPHSKTVSIKIENLDYLYREFDSCEYCHEKGWLDMRFENVNFMSGRFCSMQCWQKACKSECYCLPCGPYECKLCCDTTNLLRVHPEYLPRCGSAPDERRARVFCEDCAFGDEAALGMCEQCQQGCEYVSPFDRRCRYNCHAPRKRPYPAPPATPPPRRRPREDEPRTPDTLPKRQRRASYKRWLNEGEHSLMGFGKYEGKTFAWVLENRPDYVAWVEKNVSPSPVASQEEFVAWLDSEERWGS